MKMLAADAPPLTSTSSSELFFGDFESDCLYCGKESSAQYCSEQCELADKRSPTTEDEDLLPALTSGWSHSSTSSQCSTPDASPLSKADKSAESDVAVLDLGEPVEQLLSRSLRANLNFDYSYKMDANQPQPQAVPKGSPRSLDLRLEGPLHAPYIQAPLSLGKTPTKETLRLRRTPLQNPTLPRKATTNLLSPVLQPSNSPQLKPKPKPKQQSFKLSQPPTRDSKHRGSHAAATSAATASAAGGPSSGCGKPGCASLAGSSGGIGMVRRASAPLTRLTQRQSSSSSHISANRTDERGEESAIASSSSSNNSDDDNDDAEQQQQPESTSRGRSRQLSTYAAADMRGRSRARIAATTSTTTSNRRRAERRADSADAAPSDHRGAPVCTHQDKCLSARPLCGQLQKTRTTAAAAAGPQAIVTRSTDGYTSRRQFYGRAPPRVDPEQEDEPTNANHLSDSSANDDLDAVDFQLGSPAADDAPPSPPAASAAPEEESSADEEEEEQLPAGASPPRRGRRNTAGYLVRIAAEAQSTSEESGGGGRGRSEARGSSAAAYRSRSPNRAYSRLRRLS